jgi:ribosomal protein S6-L-glutamate ligase RimK-like protein
VKPLISGNFWIKLRHWEYWPWYIVYVPVFIYWLWCGLKARAIFYLSAANPGFEYGGIIGSSKKAILNKIPKNLVPNGILIAAEITVDKVLREMDKSCLNFPVVVKPDIGERGFKVELIQNKHELEQYLKGSKDQLIMQEYIDLPMEAGIFYYRLPNEEKGVVSSVVLKALLVVTGDGKSSIHELMLRNERSRLQINRIVALGKIDLSYVPQNGEGILLEPIGNHVRGTKFVDGNYLINQKLIDIIDDISRNIEGFYYGRFDLRCKDEEALYAGVFKIMELNGSVSEPAHIYSPGFPLLEAYRVLLHHWRILYKISTMNHKNGVPYMSFRTGLRALGKSRFTR